MSDFYKYNPSTNTWTQVSDFVEARSSAVAFSWKGKGYVGTGYTGQYKNDFYKYDPNLDSWAFVGYMDTIGRYEACAFVLNDIPYILTGSNGGGQRLKSMFSRVDVQKTIINGADISILNPGRLSIGTTVHNGYLQIANTADNRKIVLNEVVNDNTQYDGFGTNTNELRYNVASTASSHNFYANTSNIFTIKGNGKIGINGVSPNGLLQFPNTADNRKIVLNEVVNDNTQYDGFGTNTNELRYNVANTASIHNFYANTNKRFSILGPAVSFDPDQNAGTIGIGQIADGGMWSVGLGIGGNNGNTWGIGSGGGSLYIGLGNGVTSNSIQTAIEFNKNRNIHLVPISGKVGLGMTAPNGELQFANTMNNRKIVLWEVANNDHQFYGIGIESGTLRYQVAGGGNVHRFYAGTSATTSNLLVTIFDDGNVTIAGALTQNSDAALKKNILPISSSVSSILALQGYHYQWKDGFKDQNLQSGFLAQEVEKIYPHLVSKDEKGLRSVNYIGLMPYMVEEMKVQQRKYTALSEEHDLLKNKYTDLEQRLKILEDKLRE
ncbi:MAG: tail fiber domain-containing protein [Saprospiraceae bacterium]|nr:tail fiber domain-containing protein [Saprospiraceae bacterium]